MGSALRANIYLLPFSRGKEDFLIRHQVLADCNRCSPTALEKSVPEIQKFVEPGN